MEGVSDMLSSELEGPPAGEGWGVGSGGMDTLPLALSKPSPRQCGVGNGAGVASPAEPLCAGPAVGEVPGQPSPGLGPFT